MQCNVMEQSEGMPIKGKLYVTNLMSQPSPFVSSVSACFNVMSILWNVCNGHVFHISFFVVKIFTAHPTPPTTGWSWARPEPGMRPARRAPVQKEHCSSARVIKRLLKLHNFFKSAAFSAQSTWWIHDRDIEQWCFAFSFKKTNIIHVENTASFLRKYIHYMIFHWIMLVI